MASFFLVYIHKGEAEIVVIKAPVVATTTPPIEIQLPAILKNIAKCESGLRQFNKDGTVLHGIVNNEDIGYFQINESAWLKKSQALGFDIYTLRGNQMMGLWIYNHYSTKPWVYSSACWDK